MNGGVYWGEQISPANRSRYITVNETKDYFKLNSMRAANLGTVFRTTETGSAICSPESLYNESSMRHTADQTSIRYVLQVVVGEAYRS